MTLDSCITLFIATLVVACIPGPSRLLLIYYALQYGRWAGRFTIPAIILGDIIALFLAFISLEVLLKIYPESLYVIKIIGGVYVTLLGISSILSKKNIEQENKTFHKPPGRRIFTHVLIVTTFNPKTIIFFLAFFPQFINPAQNMLKQFIIMGGVYTVIGGIAAIIYDLVAHKISRWIKKPSTKRGINIITGILLCSLGIITIFF